MILAIICLSVLCVLLFVALVCKDSGMDKVEEKMLRHYCSAANSELLSMRGDLERYESREAHMKNLLNDNMFEINSNVVRIKTLLDELAETKKEIESLRSSKCLKCSARDRDERRKQFTKAFGDGLDAIRQAQLSALNLDFNDRVRQGDFKTNEARTCICKLGMMPCSYCINKKFFKTNDSVVVFDIPVIFKANEEKVKMCECQVEISKLNEEIESLKADKVGHAFRFIDSQGQELRDLRNENIALKNRIRDITFPKENEVKKLTADDFKDKVSALAKELGNNDISYLMVIDKPAGKSSYFLSDCDGGFLLQTALKINSKIKDALSLGGKEIFESLKKMAA